MLQLDKLLAVQSAFNQGRFIDYATASPQQRMKLSKDLVLHLLHEVHEVLDHLDWKMHKKPGGEIDKFAAAIELVDVLKFWAAIPTIWGISPELLTYIHERKSRIVEGRWELEHRVPATGPAIHVDYNEVMLDMAADGPGLLNQLVDFCDGTLVVSGASDLNSEQDFVLEYILTGLRQVSWRRGEFPDDPFSFIGIRVARWQHACHRFDVFLPAGQSIDGYPGRTEAQTFKSGVDLITGYVRRYIKEMTNG